MRKSRLRWLIPAIAILTLGACEEFNTASGQVVDQYGNPVGDVLFTVTGAAISGGEFDAYAGEQTMRLPDGRFSVSCGACTAVRLSFHKDGYYGTGIDLAVFEMRRGMEVVLRRAVAPVRLRRYEGRIEAGPSIDDRVLGITTRGGQVRPRSEFEAANADGAVPFVTLHYAVDDAGAILKRADGARRMPAAVALDFSHAAGGAMTAAPAARQLRLALQEMHTAPEGDYPPRLVLDSRAAHTFFYCRIEGRACKGVVHQPLGGRPGEDVVTAVVELWLAEQTGGSSLDDPTTW